MEMKRNWVKPLAVVQQFVPNEYVAACGDENKVYKFVCDAGDGRYGGLYDKDWKRISSGSYSYHACGETHDATTQDDFIEGFFDPDTDHRNGNELSVYIWLEKNRHGSVINKHATTDLDIDSWETAKS